MVRCQTTMTGSSPENLSKRVRYRSFTFSKSGFRTEYKLSIIDNRSRLDQLEHSPPPPGPSFMAMMLVKSVPRVLKRSSPTNG